MSILLSCPALWLHFVTEFQVSESARILALLVLNRLEISVFSNQSCSNLNDNVIETNPLGGLQAGPSA